LKTWLRQRRTAPLWLLAVGPVIAVSACGDSESGDPHPAGGSGASRDGSAGTSSGHTSSGGASAGSSAGEPQGGSAGEEDGSGGTVAKAGTPGSGGNGGEPAPFVCDPPEPGPSGSDDFEPVDCSMLGPEPGGELAPELLGEPCSSPGALACNGSNQKQTVLCNGGTWQAFQTCSSTQNCDGVTGICSDIIEPCATREPFDAFCDGDRVLVCNADRVSVVETFCCGRCADGACQAPRCGDGKITGDEECDDGNLDPADGCEPDCKVSKVLSLSAGLSHTCALLYGGSVRCWGDNEYGQLGQGDTDAYSHKKPFEIPPVDLCGRAVQIAAGGEHTCALLEDGSVQCWGRNHRGQLGLGHQKSLGDDEPPQARVELGGKARFIAAGGWASCAILENDALVCWGANDFGQLGLGHTEDVGDDERPVDHAVDFEQGVRSVATSGDHTCAVLDDNQVYCWGRNSVGELGLGHQEDIGDDELPNSELPIEFIVKNVAFESIVAGGLRTCVVRSDGFALCWGYNGDGRMGIGAVTAGSLQMNLNDGHEQLTVGGVHACARYYNNRARCWGLNPAAQLGIDQMQDIGDDESPAAVPFLDLGMEGGSHAHVADITAGGLHTCALTKGGAVYCWGYNAEGQLGLGYRSIKPPYVGGTPETIPALIGQVQVLPISN
jgi:cysteine-rich repeat protein